MDAPWFQNSGLGLFSNGEVQDSKELERIVALPRRVHTPEFAEEMAAKFTQALRKPGGTWNLRPIQGLALYDIATTKGLVAPIGVGFGKTIISLLSPRVLGSRKPLILVPASLKEKTFDEMEEIGTQFVLPPFIRVESYEFLSRISGAVFLDQYAPDSIICDEAHRLKNRSASCTKRVRRYLKDNYESWEKHGTPKCSFLVMSGTLTKRSLMDYSHLSAWALGDKSPVPRVFPVLKEWCGALDEGATIQTLGPGALEKLGHLEPVVCQQSARRAYRDRFVQTPGVVATQQGALDTSLEIDATVVPVDQPVRDAMGVLRETWTLPDGHEIIEGVDRWRHAREIGIGFYYKWDPWPPPEWNMPRSAWGSEMRKVLNDNRRQLDTDLQLRLALDRNPQWYPKAYEALKEWEKVKDTFIPNTVPVFLSDATIKAAENWAHKHKGIVWCEHQAWGAEFERITGIPCYGESGLDSRGNRIEHHPKGTPLAARIRSNCTGRNLQAWSENLIVSPPPSGMTLEQLLGRTHRPGQDADTVRATIMFSCAEHVDAWGKCIDDAAYVQNSQGVVQKILYADVIFDLDDIRSQVNANFWSNAA